MKKMQKTTLTIFSQFLLLPLFVLGIAFTSSVGVSAFTGSPNSGNYTASQSVNIQILASPQAGENAVTINLSATNLTITNFVAASGGNWIGAIGECSGSVQFNASQVCVSLAKSTDITASEVLGTLTVTMPTSGQGVLSIAAGSAYSDGVDQRDLTQGALGTYTVSSSSTSSQSSVLPNTSVVSDSKKYVNLVIAMFLFLGAAAAVVFSVVYPSFKSTPKSAPLPQMMPVDSIRNKQEPTS